VSCLLGCAALGTSFLPRAPAPVTIVFTHTRSQLERKGGFSATNLLIRGVKSKKKLIGLCLAKVYFIPFIQIFKGLGAEKHKNSENSYSLSKFLQSFCNKNRKLL